MSIEKVCEVCHESKEVIFNNLSDREIKNLHILDIPTTICGSCYHKALSAKVGPLKEELAILFRRKELLQKAYHKSYSNWKAKADLFQALDYNKAITMHKTNQAELAKKQSTLKKQSTPKSTEQTPEDIAKLAKKILSGLSKAQQDAIMKNFAKI